MFLLLPAGRVATSSTEEMSPIPILFRPLPASAWWRCARAWLLMCLALLSCPPALAQLSVSSSFSQSNIAAGQGSALTLTLRNSGSSALLLLAFAFNPIGGDAATSSTLLAQTSAVVSGTTVSLGTTCPAATVTRINGNQGVQLSSTTLNAGASCTISVPYAGSIGVALNKVVTITPKAASVSTGSVAVSATFTANNAVSLWNNFQLTKAGSPKYVAAGDPVFFEIQINNFSGQAINGLTVNDKLQSNSAMVTLPGWTGSTGLPAWSATNTSQPAALGSCTVASVTGPTSYPLFTLNNVPMNGACTLGFWAALPKDVAENATPINSLELGAVSWVNPATSVTVANASQASTQMQVIAPLAISASFSPNNASEGSPVTLNFTLANSSAGTVNNLAFSTTLPLTALGRQLRVASPANASTTCSGGSVTAVAGGNAISLSGGALGPRTINPGIVGKNQASTCTVSVQVIGPADTYTLALPKQALSGSGNYAIDGSAYTPKSSALTAPAPASLTYNNPILVASKAFAPSIIGDGGVSTVTVTLNNNGSGPLGGLAVNDPLPPYMTVASPANASSTCSGATVTAVPGTASVTMSGGNLPATSSCQMVFDVIGSGAAPWVNTIPSGGVTASGGVQNLLPISATLANSTPPAVVVSATLAPATLATPGQGSVLTILLQNKSPQALSNLRLSDYFTINGTAATTPTGMQLLAPVTLGSTCSGAVLNAAGDGGGFSMTGASLPFGASCTITANVTTTKAGTAVNVIPVQAVASGEGVSNPVGATVSLTAGGAVDVVKSFTPALVRPGYVSRLRLALSHATPVPLSNLTLTDNLPSGLVVASPANAVTTCSGGSFTSSAGQVRLTGASMPAAAGGASTCSVEVDVVASNEGHYTNTLQVGDVTGSFDGGPASNVVAASAALEVRNAVQITNSFAPVAVARQVPATATITLSNGNALALTALRLVDALPPNLMLAPTPNAATTCAGGSVAVDVVARTVTLNGATLPAAGTCRVSVDVVSDLPGTYTNSISAHALQDHEGVDNDLPASATLTVLQPPTLSKQFSAPQIRAGGVSTLILALGNDNGVATSLTAALVDTLPGGMTVAAIPNLGGSCDLSQVSAVAGATAIRYAGGAVLPAGGCTIQVNVTVAAEGSYSNLIAAGALLTTAGSNLLPAAASLTANPLGVISGKVFLDSASAPNGIYDGSKPGIAGVVVGLTGTSYGPDGAPDGGDDVAVNLQATTDASGSYSFGALMAGQYTVSLAAHPPNTVTGITSAGPVQGGGGGSSGTASAVTAWPSSISGIVILIDGSGRTASSGGNNFAALAQAAVAGRVYADHNNNGVFDGGETGIANVTLQLSGVDWNGNAVARSTLSASDGRYQFADLPPSGPAGYTLTELQPAGYLDGKTSVPVGKPGVADSSKPVVAGGMDAIHGVVVQAGDVLADYNFAEVPTLVMGGRVYADANNNGVVDAGESGIANVQIQLAGRDGAGNVVQRSIVSASDGRYSFDNLPPSDATGYTLTELQPVGYLDGKTSVPVGKPGVADSSKPVAAGGTDVMRGIVAVAGDVLQNYNFGEIALASVSGRVYADSNNNGVLDAGETGIANVTVQLAGVDWAGNGVSRSVLTTGDGRYQFANLPPSGPAGYTLTELQPPGYLDGKTSVPVGKPGVADSSKPVVAGGMDAIHGVVVQAGDVLADYNFGEIAVASVSGRVYADSNNNGVLDAGETGIANVTVQLAGVDWAGNAVSRTVLTTGDGRYQFANVLPSGPAGYTVTELQPAGYLDGKTSVPVGKPGVADSSKPVVAGGMDAIHGVLVQAGDVLADYNFAEVPTLVIAGRVYVDLNNNGVVDAGESGIANVQIQLSGRDIAGNVVQRTTLSAANGLYSFDNLPPSDAAGYTLTEIQPAGYLDGRTTVPGGQPGVAGSTKPVAVGGTDTIAGIVAHVGDVLNDYRFAEVPTLSIAGRVFIDRNDNGIVEPGDTGIANVTIRLDGKDVAGNVVQRSTVTGADGVYRFDNLPPSEASGYSLTEIQPANYPDGRTTVPSGQPGMVDAGKPVAAGGADVIRGIVAHAGDMLVDYNFAERASLFLQLPVISGYVYLNADHSGTRPADSTQAGVAGWTVQLAQNGAPVCSVQSNAQGFYQFDNLHCPGYQESGLPTGSGFDLTFLSNGNVASATANSGNNRGDVSVVGKIMGISLSPTDQVFEQNLPLDPSGVVYDAQTRQPLAGATVTLSGPAGFDPAQHLVSGQASQVTGANGFYQFLLQSGFPPGLYRLAVLGPSSYQPGTATSMPPCNGELTVGALPSPARVQASNGAPGVTVPVANPAACVGIVAGGAASAQYYLGFVLTGASAAVLNNHLPLDKAAAGLLSVLKSTPMVRVARGDLVPYSITVINNRAHPVAAVNLVDQMPPGFKYRRGSASLDHVPLEPVMNGRVMAWRGQNFQANEKKTYRLILVVGAGVEPGDYINQAWAVNVDNRMLSGVAQASTRVVAEPTLDCPDLIGKVFEDRNGNGYQDPGEPGLAGVRLVTPRGVLIHTDAQGRFHVPCPELPNQDRGSNFVLKLDTRTLPEGYRLSTENPASVRLTRGKIGKISFGAVRYRILRLNLGDAAFVPGLSDLLPQWDVQLDPLVERLQEAPSIVQLHYALPAVAQPPGLDMLRLQTLRDHLLARWQAQQGPYLLRIEIESGR